MASLSVPAGSATDWEARYQAGNTPWDKGRAHPVLLRWLERHAMTGQILVPGCGSGHDVRALAANPHAIVFGLDLAPSAIALAQNSPRVGKEDYLLGDFLAGAAKDLGPFDWIFEHTCFCAIDPLMRPGYAKASAAALKTGGHLLAVFYRDPESNDGPPYGCTLAEIDALFSPWFELISEEKDFETFEGRKGREILRLMRRKSHD